MASVNLLRTIAFRGLNYIATSQKVSVRTIKRWVAPTLKELRLRQKRLGPQPAPIRSTFLEWNYKAEWYAFGKRLNEEFDADLLKRAFTHRSYIIKEEELQKDAGIESPEISLQDNTELIESGENFMNFYIKNYLYLLLPKFPEEGIRAVRSHLLSDDVLAHVSLHIGTKDLILSSETPPEQDTLALTLKAVVGALLESSGAERTGLFVRDFIVTQLVSKDVNEIWQPDDPLSTLKDILLREGRSEPEPRLTGELGKNTILAAYQVAVYSDKQFLGSGVGETIPVAVNSAALDALKRLFNTTEDMAPFSFKLNPYDLKEHSVPFKNLYLAEWKLQ